jgi:hypothetical protein
MRLRPSILLLASLVAIVPLPAQQRQWGRVLGVFDDVSGKPIPGAEVIDRATGIKAVTSVSGAVTLAWLEPGPTVLQVRSMGYASRLLTVVTSATDTVSITVLLRPLAQTLPEVVTTTVPIRDPRLAEFEEHRARGLGHFITREQLDKDQFRLTAEIMMRIPGLTMVQGPTTGLVGNTRGQSSSSGAHTAQGFCLAAVVVDGHLVFSGIPGQPRFSVNSFRPDQIAGIEYYAGGATPIEYSGTRGTCGLVMIWTR